MISIIDRECLQGLSIFLVAHRPFNGLVLVSQNLLLNLFNLLFSLFDLVLVLAFHFQELFVQDVGLLGGLERELGHLLGGRAKSEQIGVESRHMRLNMIIQEGLEQVRPVDLHWDFFEEVVDV